MTYDAKLIQQVSDLMGTRPGSDATNTEQGEWLLQVALVCAAIGSTGGPDAQEARAATVQALRDAAALFVAESHEEKPQDDPTRIDWPARQATAAIPFRVIDGRPVNPCERTRVRRGRGQLRHWGEGLCADALVEATDHGGHRWIVMVERNDGHGWALPGGHVDPGETPAAAAVRELAEETGLTLPDAVWHTGAPRYVPDPRASDEAWMVTVPSRTHIGTHALDRLPKVRGADDARYATWVLADTYDDLFSYVLDTFLGQVFPAHRRMLADLLDGAA